MTALRLFCSPSCSCIRKAEAAAFHSANGYGALMDNRAMWDPETIEAIVRELPQDYLPREDLYLLLIECVANAAVHARARSLAFYMRCRSGILLLSFFQNPPMQRSVVEALHKACGEPLSDCLATAPGGLGFPLLLRLARHMTITADRTRLQLWVRLRDVKW